MPSPRRFAGVLACRRVPVRTRSGLLAAELRRRLRPSETYRISYGDGILYLSNSDYEIDWETLKNTLVDEPYAADYDDATLVDIGAHKGYFGAYAIAHGAQTVVSYEPASENADLLERSASLAVHGGRWTVVLLLFLLTIAGSETTRNAIAGGLIALLDHPDQLARLRREPDLMRTAVEEILRWTSPVAYFARRATRRGSPIKGM